VAVCGVCVGAWGGQARTVISHQKWSGPAGISQPGLIFFPNDVDLSFGALLTAIEIRQKDL